MRRVLILAGALAILSLIPATAEAKYWLSKSQAERWAESIAADDYGHDYYDVFASCRPQGARRAERGYVYNRWVCGWSAPAVDENGEPMSCGGVLLIRGVRRPGVKYLVLRGERCY